MRKSRFRFGMLLVAFLLTACGGESEAGNDALDEVSTAAALTSTALYTQIAATNTQAITATSMPTAMETATASPTQIPSVPTISNPIVPSGCDGAAFLADVSIPDYTEIVAGESFEKIWSMQNIGTCDWSTSFAIAYVSGDLMGGSTSNLNEIVSAGESGEISLTLTAPLISGDYTGYWRLQNEAGTFFGDTVYVIITVAADASETPSPSATSDVTSTATETATSASTSTSAATSAATDTPTETPTETFVPSETPTETATATP